MAFLLLNLFLTLNVAKGWKILRIYETKDGLSQSFDCSYVHQCWSIKECALQCSQLLKQGCNGHTWNPNVFACSFTNAENDGTLRSTTIDEFQFTTEFSTDSTATSDNCADVYHCACVRKYNSTAQSGIYTASISAIGWAGEVWCDMDLDGGAWTVFMARIHGNESFVRQWNEYETGFGSVSGDHWLGLRPLYRMLRDTSGWDMRVEIEDWDGNTAHTICNSIDLSGKSDDYEIELANCNGNDGLGLSSLDEVPFSTIDVDNGIGNCSGSMGGGGFWYDNCLSGNRGNPTGIYYNGGVSSEPNGMFWSTWQQHLGDRHYSMKKIIMLIRANP